MLWIPWSLACTSGTAQPALFPSLFAADPELREPEQAIRLARRVVATTVVPTRATLRIDDGASLREVRFPDLATAHDLPVLALHAQTAYTFTVTVAAEDGRKEAVTFDLDTGLPFEPMPDIEVLTADASRMEPGFTVFPCEFADGAYLIAVDTDGRLVWIHDTALRTRAVSFRDGVFGALRGTGAERWTPAGDTLVKYSLGGGGSSVQLPFDIHHELLFDDDDAFWTWRKEPYDVEAYPTSEFNPQRTAPATIDDDVLVHIGPDAAVLSAWSMAERLVPERIGYGSRSRTLDGLFDWAHANGVTRTPNGEVLVSLRHQDAVVTLDTNGVVQSILGNHDGWPGSHQELLLTPVDDGTPFAWPYHQHAPMVAANGEIVLFDNGNDRRTTPYSQDPDPLGLYTRLVTYAVDREARTVRQTFATLASDTPLYSQALGNADFLTVTGNLLGTFAYLESEDGIPNGDVGRGLRSVRIAEVDRATGDVVFALRVFTDRSIDQGGVLTDRAIRIPTLYGAGVVEEWL